MVVAAGGFLGAVARFLVSTYLNKASFPYGTLLANVTGAFCLGWLLSIDVPHEVLLFFGTGFLGAFTTFSTWLLESAHMPVKKVFFYIGITCCAGFLGSFVASEVYLLF